MMRPLKIFFLTLLCAFVAQTQAQQDQNSTNDSQRIYDLLASKTFQFTADTMLPLGMPSKSLAGDGYVVSFKPEMVNSQLPYYGRRYGGAIMGRDKGMRFQGPPENFNISPWNKGYEVKTTINDNGSGFQLLLQVAPSGYATLSISSADRDTINYQGEIIPLQE